MIPRPLAMAIVVLVTIVWVANFAARLWIPGYEPDITINGIFMVIVGSTLLASRRAAAAAAGEDDDEDNVELPDGMDRPPGFDQARRLAAELIDPPDRRRRPPAGGTRHGHRRKP